MTDIFQSWKMNRFIVAPKELVLDTNSAYTVILTDIAFWAEHADELKEWCWDRDAVNLGMTVDLGSERTLMEFVLKWS